MTCFYPLHGWRSRKKSKNGKYGIVFQRRDGWSDKPKTVPCGQCIGCRLENSRQWAVRCVHEASLYDDNCFLTLTYNDDHIPINGSLNLSDFQKFMKKLRKKFRGQKIRFYHCGEYGDLSGRPHYHALLFNFDFPDKKHYKTKNGHRLYKSEICDQLWSHPVTKVNMGDALIGNLTFQSAAYCSRYIMKKITGEMAFDHYGDLLPEYTTMSRKNGIGHDWLKLFETDVYPDDYVVINGVQQRPPKFYDTQFEILKPDEFRKIKNKRINSDLNPLLTEYDNTERRLRTREIVKKAQIKSLTRGH